MPDAATQWWESLDPLLVQSIAQHPNLPCWWVIGMWRWEALRPARRDPEGVRVHKLSSLTTSGLALLTLECHKIIIVSSIYRNMKIVRLHSRQTEPGFNVSGDPFSLTAIHFSTAGNTLGFPS